MRKEPEEEFRQSPRDTERRIIRTWETNTTIVSQRNTSLTWTPTIFTDGRCPNHYQRVDLSGWKRKSWIIGEIFRAQWKSKELHDANNEYPLAAETLVVGKVEKLIPNLSDKL